MEIHTVKHAQEHLNQLIDLTHDYNEPIYILGDKNKGVLISEEEYTGLQETLYLLSIPGMRESLIEGKNTPIEECSDKIEWD
jgi:antitoxin YefM